MPEEHKKHSTSKTPIVKKSNRKSSFLKKFLLQSLISVLIFSAIFVPELFGEKVSAPIKQAAKDAFSYTINLTPVTDLCQKVWNKLQKKGESQIEDAKNSESTL